MDGIPKRIFSLTNRKKRIRGFRRFLFAHQQRAAIPAAFDAAYFQQQHRDYQKLGLAPWAVNEKPPLSIRRLWVGRLVADFHRWHQVLATRYPDFYLAVWLFEPEFGRSQLVAGIEEKQAWYEGVFGEPIPNFPLPDEYMALPDMAGLYWTARAEIAVFWPDEFDELSARTRNRPYRKTETADGQPIFVVQIGLVWVGQLSHPAR